MCASEVARMCLRISACAQLKFCNSKLVTLVESNPKAPFSIATTPRCRGERFSIAPFYLSSLPYNAEC